MDSLDVSQAFQGLGRPARFQVVKKSIADHETVETTVASIYINLVLHAMEPRKLDLKPEGQRRWKWLEGWSSDKLEIDWTLVDAQGLRYRVMASTDWSQANFYKYEITQGPRPINA